MRKYILKRLVVSIVTIWLIATASFFLIHSLPGNPIAVNSSKILSQETLDRLTYYYGLDKPIGEQYLTFLSNLLHGNFGYSYKYPGQTVNGIIASTFPISAQLGMQAYLISIPVGFALGIIAAWKRGKAADYLLVAFSAIGVSVPVFILAAVFQLVFAVQLKWFPVSLWKNFSYTILPTFTLAIGSIAGRTRGMRTLMLEIINEDYMKTAKAKGLSNLQIVWSHQIRNAVIPMIPMMGLELVGMLMGSFVVEQIFAIPGIGSYFVTSVQSLDYTMVLGLTVFLGIFVVAANFLVDIIYGIADPRIRVTE